MIRRLACSVGVTMPPNGGSSAAPPLSGFNCRIQCGGVRCSDLLGGALLTTEENPDANGDETEAGDPPNNLWIDVLADEGTC